ncbi:hypothetical protein [Algibacillus agarilyticus]|uniref:hypothetical protein n=1 Tax=Algibacillus agarilyticus TaxID=2234133 RepID=UPI000DCF9E47|nr:hypothetical protein [Algibacillus agarilyticus]
MSGLLLLYTNPKQFFSDQVAVQKTLSLFIVSWAYGIFHTLDRLDRHLLKESLNRPWPGWELVSPLVDGSWLNFWAFLIIVGLMAGGVAYYLGGWWYKIRLGWAGAKNIDKHQARHIHIYVQFVMSFPSLIFLVAQTFIYPDYRTAWQADIIWLMLLTVFPFWSCATSYYAATHIMHLKPKLAFYWFVLLPACIYIMSYYSYWYVIEAIIAKSG